MSNIGRAVEKESEEEGEDLLGPWMTKAPSNSMFQRVEYYCLHVNVEKILQLKLQLPG